jgi:hypothetical protein
MRNADKIDAQYERNLTSFLVPERWIFAAKAAFARYRGDSYEASRLYLEAREEKFACDLVISDLAPDIIIRADFPLLKQLFEDFNPEKIDDWAVRGKVSIFIRSSMFTTDHPTALPRLYRSHHVCPGLSDGDSSTAALPPLA